MSDALDNYKKYDAELTAALSNTAEQGAVINTTIAEAIADFISYCESLDAEIFDMVNARALISKGAVIPGGPSAPQFVTPQVPTTRYNILAQQVRFIGIQWRN